MTEIENRAGALMAQAEPLPLPSLSVSRSPQMQLDGDGNAKMIGKEQLTRARRWTRMLKRGIATRRDPTPGEEARR